jgi:glyoxylase-like metal-dependent hydrolase (beta-lactamase superfamily II)
MNRRTFVSLAALPAVSALMASPPARAFGAVGEDTIRIGHYTFEGPGTVNTWWIETPRSVIVIDLQRDLAHAREALAAVEALGKPVSHVLVTHGHPDHYAGLGLFKARWPGIVSWSSQATRETITSDHYGFNAFLQQAFGDNFPNPVLAPERTFAPDTMLTLDGVVIVAREFGPSDANTMTVFYLPDTGDLFSGDIILSGMHLFFNEGASGPWLTALERLEREFPGARTLHPGHGVEGMPRALIREARDYAQFARAVARREIARTGSGPETIAAINAALLARFPDRGNPVGLPNFLDISTAGLVRELSR